MSRASAFAHASREGIEEARPAQPGGLGRRASAAASNASQRLLAAKWLTAGALLGGAASFIWLRSAQPIETAHPAASALVEIAAPAPSASLTAPRFVSSESAPEASGATTAPPRPAPHTTGSTTTARAAALGAPTGIEPSAPAPSTPDLAAEVAALDGIRTALAIGAWPAAEQQLASYRRDFARGALRSEAEVLAIEALIARGNRPAALSAAERFIAEHARDPQVARVRALVEGAR